MRVFKINCRNFKKEKELIASSIIRADNYFSKLFGLITRKKPIDREGFLIEDCSSIHTFWMRYSIDVVFLNKKNFVLAVFQNVKPFRITPFVRNAFFALELRSGTIEETSLKVGDLIHFEA